MTAADIRAADRLLPYQARQSSFAGVREIAGFRMKVYEIAADNRVTDDAVLAAAIEAARRTLRDPDADLLGLSPHGLGFIIVHYGEDAVWILVDWWVDGAILAQRLFRADIEGPESLKDVSHAGLMSCVWEGEIIDFERRAFIETMMTARPNATAYLVRSLSGPI